MQTKGYFQRKAAKLKNSTSFQQFLSYVTKVVTKSYVTKKIIYDNLVEMAGDTA